MCVTDKRSVVYDKCDRLIREFREEDVELIRTYLDFTFFVNQSPSFS
jgi:hypothetical protein